MSFPADGASYANAFSPESTKPLPDARARRPRCREVVVTTVLPAGERDAQGARSDLPKHRFAQRVVARALEQPHDEHGVRRKRLDHCAPAHGLGDDRCLEEPRAQPAAGLGYGEREPAEVRERLPGGLGTADRRLQALLAGVERIAFQQEPLRALAQHLLFVGQPEIHGWRPQKPKASFAMMFFCTSRAPP